MNSFRPSNAFTLLEVLFSLAIILFLISLAAPSIQALILKSSIKTQALEIRRALELARGLAVSQGVVFKLCTSDQSYQCVKHSGLRLLVFRDSDNNHRLDPTESLYLDRTLQQAIKLSASGRSYIRFKNSGEALDSGNFLVCAKNRAIDFGRQAIVFRSGRIRLSKDNNHDGYDDRGKQQIRC